LSKIVIKLNRGVSKIAEEHQSAVELDSKRVQEIVMDVFQKAGLVLPYSIKFTLKPSMGSNPQTYFEENHLCIIASSEPELKRLIGRFVIKQTWSPHEWLLTNHVGFYILISTIILVTLPGIGFQLSWMISELRPWILLSTIISFSIFAFWTGNQVSIRSAKLLRKLTTKMADLGCMTEYDFKDYTPDYHKISVGGTVICIGEGLVFGSYGMVFYLESSLLFIIPLLLLSLCGLYFLFTSSMKAFDTNLCFENEESEEEDEGEDWQLKFEDSDYLQTKFTDLIDRMELQDAIQSKHKSEYRKISANFLQTKYAQCRGVYDHIEDDTFYINCHDISEAAAFRYGTALLLKSSLRFFREVSLKRRLIQLWMMLIGLSMIAVALVGSYTISKEFGIGSLGFTAVLFLIMGYISWKQNDEVRRDLPIALQKSGVFKDYELKFYNNFMFSDTSKSDWSLLIVFLLIFIGIAYLIHMLV